MKKPIILLLFFSFLVSFPLHAQENIALGKPVEASDEYGGNKASNVNDGKGTATRWETTHGQDNQWIKIDLQDVYELISTKIVWEGASAKEYEIEVSGNGTTWTPVAEKYSTAGARTDEFTFDSNEVTGVRYVRLNLLTRTTTYGFSIYEWEIYGIGGSVILEATTLDIKPKNVVLQTEIPEEFLVLSLNNSLIDYNNQNEIFEQIAVSGGKNASWTKQTRLGQSLRYHYEEGDGTTSAGPSARLTVRSQPWTHIILQEQSDKPLTNPTDFLESVRLWVDYIRTYCPNPNAKIILTLNWPYVESADYAGEIAALYANYQKVQHELGVSICPVGNAYDMIRTIDGISAMQALYTDNRHPTLLASYLAACTVYAHLFYESPEGLYYPSQLSAADATRMQAHAWKACTEHDDPINEYGGTVKYTCSLLDQFNRNMEIQGNITWNVSGGGTIQDGVFRSNGELGEFTITADYGNISGNVTFQVVKGVEAYTDEYFVTLQDGEKYEQDFDEIGTDAEATLPLGWKIEKRLDSPRTLGSYALAVQQTEQHGGIKITSDARNGIYNFGAGDPATATDRAIGGISTSIADGTRGVNIYLKIKNDGAGEINRFDIAYNVEKYRMGNNAAGFMMQLYYSLDGENWFSAGDDFYTFFAADSSTGGYDVVPGETRAVSGTLIQQVKSGQHLYLAWNYSVASGTTCSGAQALGLDDFSITAGYEEVFDYAVVSVTEVYEQDFDEIGTEAEATLPLGWRIEKRLDSPRTLGSFYAAGNVTEQRDGNGMASDAKNGIYNFGAGDPATATDRAIGGVSTGIADGTRGINIYLKVKNKGEESIGSLDIEYDVEKYRKGNNSADFVMQLYYSPDGITWTSAGDAFKSVFARDAVTEGYASAPGDLQHVTATLSQAIEREEELYLAWNYSVASGTTCSGAQALGLDNVKIKSIAGISTYKPAESLKKINVVFYNKKLSVTGENIEKVSLYNTAGICMLSFSGEGETDLSDLLHGVYIVVVKETDGSSHQVKIIR